MVIWLYIHIHDGLLSNVINTIGETSSLQLSRISPILLYDFDKFEQTIKEGHRVWKEKGFSSSVLTCKNFDLPLNHDTRNKKYFWRRSEPDINWCCLRWSAIIYGWCMKIREVNENCMGKQDALGHIAHMSNIGIENQLNGTIIHKIRTMW